MNPKELLRNNSAFATTLLVLVADRLGPDILMWDPETIKLEVHDTFGVDILPSNFNKLMAAIEIVTSNTFYSSLPDFIRLCNTLYDGTFDIRTFDPADAGEIAWGVTEALLLWPPDEKDASAPFNPTIVAYIGQVIKDEGIMNPPDILQLGVGNADTLGKVQAQYSDDPEMFNAIYKVEQEKTDELNTIVRDRLRTLLQQLNALPLTSGHVTGISSSLRNSLGRISAATM